MKSHMTSPAEAAAHGARLSAVDLVCSYSAPFSAGTMNELKDLSIIETDSFSSALNAAMGAEIGGKRSFVSASALMLTEDMYVASYTRLPVVLFNTSRSPGTFSMKHDHNDIMTVRDAGWLIFMPESNQEIIDTIIQAYKVCEDQRVLLPGIVNADISYYREPVQMPNEKFTKRYISKFKPAFQLGGKKQYINVPDQDYPEFKKQQHRAMKNALEVIGKTSIDWKKKIGRTLGLIDSYKLDDADYAVVVSGFHSTTAKAAVDKMRAAGKKVGLLRIRVLRPWPAEAIKNALKGIKRIAVFDQSISLGQHGILYSELTKYVSGSDFISLGRYPSEKDFMDVLNRLMAVEKEELVWL